MDTSYFLLGGRCGNGNLFLNEAQLKDLFPSGQTLHKIDLYTRQPLDPGLLLRPAPIALPALHCHRESTKRKKIANTFPLQTDVSEIRQLGLHSSTISHK